MEKDFLDDSWVTFECPKCGAVLTTKNSARKFINCPVCRKKIMVSNGQFLGIDSQGVVYGPPPSYVDIDMPAKVYGPPTTIKEIDSQGEVYGPLPSYVNIDSQGVVYGPPPRIKVIEGGIKGAIKKLFKLK